MQRHSGSPCAKVTLTCSENQAGLEVADEGRGIEPGRAISLGVGLSGMRERVRQLGGTLEIAFRGTGTVLKAELPV